MNIRTSLVGLALVLALAGCGDKWPKARSWEGTLPSLPGYAVAVSQWSQSGRTTSNMLRVGSLSTEGYIDYAASRIIAEDSNGNGRFDDSCDTVRIVLDADSSLASLAQPQRLNAILEEALPYAINNPAYK